MTTTINGIEYKVEEVGKHSVECKNMNACFLPKRYRMVTTTDINGEEVTRRKAFHTVSAHTKLTPIN